MLREFAATHTDALEPLRDWYKKVTRAHWQNITDIRKDFRTVDYVGNDHYVFDIKGNTYRLATIVLFVNQKVYLRFVGTHAEYDKIKDIQNI